MKENHLLNWLKKHRSTLIIVGVILLILIVLGWRSASKSKPQYVFDTVSRQTVSDVVTETGNIQAVGETDIYSSIDGVVQDVSTKNGDFVNQGQRLFSVKSTATDQDKATAASQYMAAKSNTETAYQSKTSLSAQIDAAKKTLFDAQNNYSNVVKYRRQELTNPATGHHYTESDIVSAQMALQNAQGNLDSLQEKYGDTDSAIQAAQSAEEAARLVLGGKSQIVVKAPSAGFVSNLNINSGDRVSTLALSAKPVLILTKTLDMEFKTQINEIDIAKLKLGQTGAIDVDALRGQAFTGNITRIDTIGTSTGGVISYSVCFSVANPSPELRPTMSGSVTVETDKHENVLTVVNAAIKPYQNGKAVQVLQNDGKGNETTQFIPVKVGIKGGERTEIIEGLTEGMQVITNSSGNQFKSNLFGG